MPRPTASCICAVIVALALDTGCTTARANPGDGSGPITTSPPPQVQRSRDVLTFEEISAKSVPTAYDAIVQLRPEFLKPASPPLRISGLRSKQGADQLLEEREGRFPAIYLNGRPQGGPAVLRTIRATTIIEVRRYPAGHVPTAYGIKTPDGLIDVRTAP